MVTKANKKLRNLKRKKIVVYTISSLIIFLIISIVYGSPVFGDPTVIITIGPISIGFSPWDGLAALIIYWAVIGAKIFYPEFEG